MRSQETGYGVQRAAELAQLWKHLIRPGLVI